MVDRGQSLQVITESSRPPSFVKSYSMPALHGEITQSPSQESDNSKRKLPSWFGSSQKKSKVAAQEGAKKLKQNKLFRK